MDIDERAVQLASFSVLMKARAKNSRILRRSPKLNIVTVRSTQNLSLPAGKEFVESDWRPLLEAFKEADSLGSLITPPALDEAKLLTQVDAFETENPVFKAGAQSFRDLVKQARLLRQQYSVVVANPPYMGGGAFNSTLKDFVSKNYNRSKSDLFAVFLERCIELLRVSGLLGTINQQVWMFLSSYERLREYLLSHFFMVNMAHLGARAFPEIGGEVVQSTAFVLKRESVKKKAGLYIRLIDYKDSKQKEAEFSNLDNRYLRVDQENFRKIPGSAITYWISEGFINAFVQGTPVDSVATPRKGMVTADNERFIRSWNELFISNISFGLSSRKQSVESGSRWFPYHKGGTFRNWYGHHNWVVDWEDDGFRLLNMKNEWYKVGSTNHNLDFILSLQLYGRK
ncbi:MAG: hypothetical protein HC800_21740 [Phormidesmis sp. RL_2_1]|nr:hypothetical protein [Phormidesmis sp. RL_2_1]